MTLWIATLHPALILKIPLQKLGKPQSPMIQIILTKSKSSVVVSSRKKIDSMVAEMHLSYINIKPIVNTSLKKTRLGPITSMQHYNMLTY